MKDIFKKFLVKIKKDIDHEMSLFKVFSEPKPEYIANPSFMDKILDKIFFWAIPDFVKPNYVTIFRFITVPFIILFIFLGNYKVVFILFIISAFSDAIDGSLARTRNKISNWGIVFDPLADKLLIGSVGGILIFKFLNPIVAIIIVSLEIILVVSAYHRFKGKIVPAKSVGKIKMVLQSLGVSFLILYLVIGYPIILTIATYIFYLAIFFAILSILIYRSI